MKKYLLIIILFITVCFTACQNETNTPRTYKELLTYPGTNESLYEYLMQISKSDRPLFDKLYADIENYQNMLKRKNTKYETRAALLQLFSRYYSHYSTTNETKSRDLFISVLNQSEKLAIDGFAHRQINISNLEIIELTDFFIRYPFE